MCEVGVGYTQTDLILRVLERLNKLKGEFGIYVTINELNRLNEPTIDDDVIDVKESIFNSATNEWVAKIPNITEQTQKIPFSRFTKVDDKTPITTTISKTEKTYSDNQLGTVGSNTQTSASNNQTIQSNSQIKESRNNKNIIIGIFVVSAIFVFLKLKEE